MRDFKLTLKIEVLYSPATYGITNFKEAIRTWT